MASPQAAATKAAHSMFLVVVVAEKEHVSQIAESRPSIRASLLRTACRWQRALTTPDKENRIELHYALGILDTPPEDRFDRITRLAASLFDVPMALISLVDRERQWFKSTHGLNVRETSRETSFCAHAVASRNPLVVPDTFQDLRFTDNPLVSGAPRIRFYAGYPLFVRNCCVGTLCILDHRPRERAKSRMSARSLQMPAATSAGHGAMATSGARIARPSGKERRELAAAHRKLDRDVADLRRDCADVREDYEEHRPWWLY